MNLAGAPAPGEVLRYMRPTAQAGPGTPRSGGHRQSKGGKAKGTGRRGRSSVGPRAPGPVVPDAAPLSGRVGAAGARDTPSHPGNARRTRLPTSRRPPLTRQSAAPRTVGWRLAPPWPMADRKELLHGERDESTDEADGLSGIVSDDGADAGERARAQDEPLLANRQGDAPQPMDTGAGGAPLGRAGGSEDESVPTTGPLISPSDQPEDVSMSDGAGVGGAHAAPGAADTPHAERTSGQKRKEPPHDRGPKDRGPHSWVTSIQQVVRTKSDLS